MSRRLFPLLAPALGLLGLASAQAAPPAAAKDDTETPIPILFSDPAHKGAAPAPKPASAIRWPKSQGPGFWPSATAAVALTGLALGARALWARRRRSCFQCGQKMVRQTPEATFAYLEPSEKVQAATHEVQFTLWHCPACGSDDLDAQVQPMPVAAGVRPTTSPLGLNNPPTRERRGPSLLRLPKDAPSADNTQDPS
jgi:hypothetical protein